jgi:hypothetical protein
VLTPRAPLPFHTTMSTEEQSEHLTFDGVVADLRDSEADVRALQHGASHIDRQHKQSGRTDLMPGRHLAIALTALEEARLRIDEAHRLFEAQR